MKTIALLLILLGLVLIFMSNKEEVVKETHQQRLDDFAEGGTYQEGGSIYQKKDGEFIYIGKAEVVTVKPIKTPVCNEHFCIIKAKDVTSVSGHNYVRGRTLKEELECAEDEMTMIIATIPSKIDCCKSLGDCRHLHE